MNVGFLTYRLFHNFGRKRGTWCIYSRYSGKRCIKSCSSHFVWIMIHTSPNPQARATGWVGKSRNIPANSNIVPVWIGWRTRLYKPVCTKLSVTEDAPARVRMEISAIRMIIPPAMMNNQPITLEVGVVSKNNVADVLTAKMKPNAQTGMPRIFRKIKVMREPRDWPQRFEKAVVKALAVLQTNPIIRGIRKRYIVFTCVIDSYIPFDCSDTTMMADPYPNYKLSYFSGRTFQTYVRLEPLVLVKPISFSMHLIQVGQGWS